MDLNYSEERNIPAVVAHPFMSNMYLLALQYNIRTLIMGQDPMVPDAVQTLTKKGKLSGEWAHKL